MKLVLVLLLAGTLATAAVAGSWGAGGCPPPPAPVWSQPTTPAVTYSWRHFPGDDSQVALYLGETQVGGYRFEGEEFRPLKGEAWGDRGNPPIAPPPAPARVVQQAPNYGIDRKELGDREKYTFRGQEITRAEALAILAAPTLPDDSGKPWLVYVGGDTSAKLLPAALPLWRVKNYPESDWHAGGFKPGFTIMMPDGQVLWEGDAVALAVTLSRLPPKWESSQLPELLKPRPPAPVPPEPSPTPPPPPPAPGTPDHTLLCGGCAVLLAAILMLKGKKTP